MKMNWSSSPTRILVWATLAGLQPLACVTEDVDPVNATAGSGGAGGGTANGGNGGMGTAGASGANTGGGGAGGIASDPAFGVAAPCLPIIAPLITDFTYGAVAPVVDAGADGGAVDAGPVVAPDPTAVTFGDFTASFSGGIYRYPSGVGDPFAIASDISTNEWHLSGSIGNYSGLALYYAPAGCNQVNAAAYDGISFTIRGSVAMGNALTFSVNTSANEISHLWLNSQATPPNPPAVPNSGRCLPPTANQYDGSCSAGSFQVPVTETATTVTILWADLIGGRPAAAVNPAEITDIRWIFPVPPNVATPTVTPYAVDFYIDNLSFVGGP